MTRKRIVKIHVVATAVAMVTILSFFTASLYAETVGDTALILATKIAILYALPLMIFAMPTLALTGNILAGKRQSPLVRIKQRRMKAVAINGMILVALAVFLFTRAHGGRIDPVFLSAQAVELLLGAINLLLLGLNVKDGLRLSGKVERSSKPFTYLN